MYDDPDTVVSMTPQGMPEGTLVATYVVRETESDDAVLDALFEAGEVIEPVLVALFDAGPVTVPVFEPLPEAETVGVACTGAGRAVVVPSIWTSPLVALAGITIV